MAYTYLLPIRTAAALFPLLAVLLLLPTAVVLYRRHGVMTAGRFLSLFGFVYYLLTAACMTVVPLPSRALDVCARYAAMASPQLVPGNTFGDIWKEAHHRTGLGPLVLHNPAVAGALFNLLLLVPLGVFLRYHFRRGLRAAVCAGFGLSLAFELTQWTGVWGLYPCPYRLFDVDDLAVNTAGAVLGWAITAPVARLLPTLEALDGKALSRLAVPFGRRLTALLADLIGVSFTGALCVLVAASSGYWDASGGLSLLGAPGLVCAVWFVALPYATGGTPGKRLLRLCLVGATSGGPAEAWRLALRAVLLGGVLLPLFSLLLVAGLILAEHPSPFALASSAWPAGLEAIAAHAAGHAGEIAFAAPAAGLAVLLPLTVLRHPLGLGLHERLSGVRNAALPPTRAARSARTGCAADTERPAGAAAWTVSPEGAAAYAAHPVVPVRLTVPSVYALRIQARRPTGQPRHARPGPTVLYVPPTPPGAPRPWHRAPAASISVPYADSPAEAAPAPAPDVHV